MKINAPPDFFVKAVWILSTVLLLLIIYYLINIGNNFIPDRKRIRVSNSKVLPILGIFLLFYLLLALFRRYTILSDTFFTIILSAVLAYILNPIVDYFVSKGMKRLFAVITLYLMTSGIIFILTFLIIPGSSREIGKLINNIPLYFSNISKYIDELYTRYYSNLGDLPPLLQGIETAIIQNISKLENIVIEGVKGLVGGILNSFTKIISFVLTPVLTFYFLVDKDFFKKKIKESIPIKHRDEVYGLSREIDKSVSQFVRGRLIMALCVGIATTFALLIIGVDFAMVIGFITGVADVIPYIGPFLGFVPAVIFAFIASPIKALYVTIFFVLIQWVENNILGPKILGGTIGMHPLIILLSIIAGGAIFGVLGMILSVPFVAIGRIFFVFFKEKLKKPPEETI